MSRNDESMTSASERAAATAKRRPRVRQGLVVVNTGEGKGKTTAALGVMFRAWGRDFRTRMFQFIKTAGARFGEHRAAERIGIPIEAGGDGCTIRSKDTAQAAALAAEQWERCKEAILFGEDDLIVLDELAYVLHYGWVPTGDVIETLRRRPDGMHVIITGRYAPQELIDFADLVTDMRVVKHPYQDQGIKAQLGIEL